MNKCCGGLLFLAAVAQGQISNYFGMSPVPGVDFVGFGYDAKFAEARNAMTLPLLDYTWTDQKFYQYGDGARYRVPNELYVRTLAYTKADSFLYQDEAELTDRMAISVGLSVDWHNDEAKKTETCVQTYDAETGEVSSPNCTTSNEKSQKERVSISSTVEYMKNVMQTSSSVMVENAEQNHLFNVYLDSQFVRPSIKLELTKLASTPLMGSGANPQAYFDFLRKFGTHYVVSAVMGGSIRATSLVNMATTTTDTDLNVTVDGAYQKITGDNKQGALQAGKDQFNFLINPSIAVRSKTSTKSTTQTTTTNWAVLGGDSSLINLLDTRNASAAIKEWKATVPGNPVPVAYRLREVGLLFGDLEFQRTMSRAIELYLSLPDELLAQVVDVSYKIDEARPVFIPYKYTN